MTATEAARRRVAAAFAQTTLLAYLSSAERRRLAACAAIRTYAAGATIIREGDTSMAIYVVVSGRVAVQTRMGGRLQTVCEIAANGFFGELGVIDDAPRSATVVALENTECALIGTWQARRNSRIALGLLPVLAQRIRQQKGRDTRDDDAELLRLFDS
jgi:CRP-like cAMP-binding protein